MMYIIMCGGTYRGWTQPRQLTEICGEPVVARTVRLLRENGVDEIYISTHDRRFAEYAPLLEHENRFNNIDTGGSWVDGFYPTKDPACYIMGDVVFSPEAIRTIVETKTDGVQFFASCPPFSCLYIKPYGEPFAFKVADQRKFREAIEFVRDNENTGLFSRRPIAWELWNVLNGYEPVNAVHYRGFVAVNDYTCDIDRPEDAGAIERIIRTLQEEN